MKPQDFFTFLGITIVVLCVSSSISSTFSSFSSTEENPKQV